MLIRLVLQALAEACDMFTGAELAGLCREAAITALREDLQVYFSRVWKAILGLCKAHPTFNDRRWVFDHLSYQLVCAECYL